MWSVDKSSKSEIEDNEKEGVEDVMERKKPSSALSELFDLIFGWGVLNRIFHRLVDLLHPDLPYQFLYQH